MRGTCAIDEVTGIPKSCVYNGTAVPLKDETYINVLKNICPYLKTGKFLYLKTKTFLYF